LPAYHGQSAGLLQAVQAEDRPAKHRHFAAPLIHATAWKQPDADRGTVI
jgi:hypothetical protein